MALPFSTLRQIFELDQHPLRPRSAVVTSGNTVAFETARGVPVHGFWCAPENAGTPLPCVLVLHAHGARYDIGAKELIDGRPGLQSPLGPALAAQGIASLCLDMRCFGERAQESESAVSKALMWEGRSLAGQMLGESKSALDWLSANPAVRADRIGVFGISMGATLGYWLAALDDRVRALVQLCCLADFRSLIESGAHDLHGPYLTVPGLLGVASNGTLAGAMAPRAQFIGLGDRDPLTPPAAVNIALAEVRAAYDRKGGELVIHRAPDQGHVETPEMRAALMAFLSAALA